MCHYCPSIQRSKSGINRIAKLYPAQFQTPNFRITAYASYMILRPPIPNTAIYPFMFLPSNPERIDYDNPYHASRSLHPGVLLNWWPPSAHLRYHTYYGIQYLDRRLLHLERSLLWALRNPHFGHERSSILGDFAHPCHLPAEDTCRSWFLCCTCGHQVQVRRMSISCITVSNFNSGKLLIRLTFQSMSYSITPYSLGILPLVKHHPIH